ncbi:hypothetical protein VN97_g12827 [Penicillium thymicola]|uniref:Uncharacterized protein n=1 Tax=Penicillium thymicola TaxID=293382 RepID=A0AAI9T4W3_PENTH|nr:hypothetical protein VN97_g12827 [Penicillium thymicola]
MKVCRKCAIIDSHLGSIVDTRVTCRRHDRINVPVCSSLQALLWLSTEEGVRHQVTRLRGAKTGDQICRPPTFPKTELEHSDQAQHAIISQVPRGEKQAGTRPLACLHDQRSRRPGDLTSLIRKLF